MECQMVPTITGLTVQTHSINHNFYRGMWTQVWLWNSIDKCKDVLIQLSRAVMSRLTWKAVHITFTTVWWKKIIWRWPSSPMAFWSKVANHLGRMRCIDKTTHKLTLIRLKLPINFRISSIKLKRRWLKWVSVSHACSKIWCLGQMNIKTSKEITSTTPSWRNF